MVTNISNLSAYLKNGYKYTHVALMFDVYGDLDYYEVGYKRTLENRHYNGKFGHGCIEILTFRQAAAQYPEYFKFEG